MKKTHEQITFDIQLKCLACCANNNKLNELTFGASGVAFYAVGLINLINKYKFYKSPACVK